MNWVAHEEYVQIRVGKFRTPFSRQQMSSSTQLQSAGLNSAAREFALTNSGRDIGLMFHNGFDRTFEWAFAAVSNGLVLRLGYNHGAIDGYDMVDFTGGGLRYGVGISGYTHNDYNSKELDKDVRVGADFILKYQGLAANGSFYARRAEKENKFGGGLDVGYLMDHKLEPVICYSVVKDTKKTNHDIKGGFNYYFFGHHVKGQAYIGPNIMDKKISEWEGGVQFQFAI
jgi:hypothetical protein